MQYVSISVADLRAEPKFTSERISQLVYGEELKIIEKGEEYSLVVGSDGLQGHIKTALINEGPARTHKLTRRYRYGEIIIPFGGYVSRDEIKKFSIPGQFLAPISKYDYKPTELSSRGIDDELRESLGFAILANQTVHNAPGRVTDVETMSGPVLGKITPGRNFEELFSIK